MKKTLLLFLSFACASLSSTSKLTIKNGGRISIRRGKSFSAPVGAVVTITNGSIDNM
jgi:hypothetical protein